MPNNAQYEALPTAKYFSENSTTVNYTLPSTPGMKCYTVKDIEKFVLISHLVISLHMKKRKFDYAKTKVMTNDIPTLDRWQR